MVDLQTLRQVPALRGLSDVALRELAARGVERRYRRRQVIFRAGDASSGVYLVLEGRVRVIRETVERRHVVHTEGPGGTLAEVPLFAGGMLPATATAIEPTRCVLFTREGILGAFSRDPSVALFLLERLALRVRGLVQRLDRLAFLGVRARLAQHILERAAQAEGAVCSFGVTQEELAEELGTVREVVVRELRALRRAGVIRAAGSGRFAVLDAGALRRLGEA